MEMKEETRAIFEKLFEDNPALEVCRGGLEGAYGALMETYRGGGKVLCCGNGGSASDSEHIVGELMKSFRIKRELPKGLRERLAEMGEDGAFLVGKLEGALGAASLSAGVALPSAFANDVGWEAGFAQQVAGLGRAGDTLVALSTSGNSRNCVLAAKVAAAMGMRTVAFTGEAGGLLAEVCDAVVKAPARETYRVQEFHLPAYHALCAMVESEIFG